ncbi:hypothetical protein LTR56_018374 [Elasticomyces elasticus]|nr:hypothetical protein LTR56_018374 [Elasticomyces elasticus]KAK3637280.1 hypothetical protein LTR22_018314 [Elasticomyces elasticus]KAK4916447.1 hypothetical protein LTR49_015545 [Elasticomyces elasticus]KAK5756006.1 hypothetical protein LTS12_013895 [Elasticomyces elasticus]
MSESTEDRPPLTAEEELALERNREAWIAALACGDTRFYRRSWREFEGNLDYDADSEIGAEMVEHAQSIAISATDQLEQDPHQAEHDTVAGANDISLSQAHPVRSAEANDVRNGPTTLPSDADIIQATATSPSMPGAERVSKQQR